MPKSARRRFSAYEKRLVAVQNDWRCNWCQGILDERYEIDHVVALHLGGEDDTTNLQALCGVCHGHKTLQENAERMRAQRLARLSECRAPLLCLGCDAVVSPYFRHRCVKKKIECQVTNPRSQTS